MLRQSARFRLGHTAIPEMTTIESQTRSGRVCVTRPRVRRTRLHRAPAGLSRMETTTHLYHTRVNLSQALATQATDLIHVGGCHCAECHMAEIETLRRPSYAVEQPTFSLHPFQHIRPGDGSSLGDAAEVVQQTGIVRFLPGQTTHALKWQTNLVIERRGFTTAELQNMDTEYVRLMASQAMDFFEERNWPSARTHMARAEQRWYSDLDVDRPGFTPAQLQYMKINEVIQMADNAMAAFGENDWTAARSLMLCAQRLWREAQRLGREVPIIKMPGFSADETRHMDINIVLRCANQARRFLLREDSLEASNAMSRARRMWYPGMGIPCPEFTLLEKQRIMAVNVQNLDIKARSFFRRQNYASAGEAMREAQTSWRKGCQIPMPAFNVEEQSQIQAICPSLKLLCRGRPTHDSEFECAICWDTVTDVSYILGPCRHWFHDQCISKWLQSSGTCPSCRNKWL